MAGTAARWLPAKDTGLTQLRGWWHEVVYPGVFARGSRLDPARSVRGGEVRGVSCKIGADLLVFFAGCGYPVSLSRS